MLTEIMEGRMPPELLSRRKDRLIEALKMKSGTAINKEKHLIYTFSDGREAYFLKPGKEADRVKSVNPNDMLPCVYGMPEKYAFSDIWEILCILRNKIDLNEFKKLSVIIYRLAFLLDCENTDGKVRYKPNKEISEEIENIQTAINASDYKLNVLSLIYAIDLLGWNEDVKYHRVSVTGENADYSSADFQLTGNKKKTGRLNTILSCISVPLSLQEYTEHVIECNNSKKQIDFKLGLKIPDTLIKTRGIYSLENEDLIRLLSPYLTKKSKPERGLQLKIDY